MSADSPLGENTRKTTVTKCADPDCDKTLKNHAWARIKSDWFQQKDGKIWCPDHMPKWVEAWRAKNDT